MEYLRKTRPEIVGFYRHTCSPVWLYSTTIYSSWQSFNQLVISTFGQAYSKKNPILKIISFYSRLAKI